MDTRPSPAFTLTPSDARLLDEHLRTAPGAGFVQTWIAARIAEGTATLAASNMLLQQELAAARQAADLLARQAWFDALTHLPNRALFMNRLEHSVQRARRQPHYRFAVLFLDLDRFKVVNDTLGHPAGDQLLMVIADRLAQSLRAPDTVARLGGDEFTILLDDIKSVSHATRVTERILADLQLPVMLDGHEVVPSASIGIAVNTTPYLKGADMLRDADTALYQAKARGTGGCQLFGRRMHVPALARLQYEVELRRAVEHAEFCLHYQPIVALHDARVSGFEALVRWQHPTRGLIYPSEFIPLAEETGLIVPLGAWVLATACRQLAAWRAAFATAQHLTISVNLSPYQLAETDLPARVAQILDETGLAAADLKLEVAEGALMDHIRPAPDVIARLRALGVGIYVDDFGTGYAALSYLRQFPVAALKIDRPFIHRIGPDGHRSEVAESIIALTRNLGIEAIAEGVETAAQSAALQGMNCGYGQGYRFARPLTAAAAGALLEGPRPPRARTRSRRVSVPVQG